MTHTGNEFFKEQLIREIKSHCSVCGTHNQVFHMYEIRSIKELNDMSVLSLEEVRDALHSFLYE